MSWRARAESLCYEGETVERRFDLDGPALVVTSHRLLAFTPDATGVDFRAVDRPNAAGVRIEAAGYARLLRWAALVGVGGLALLGIATAVSFADPVRSADVDRGNAVAPGAGGTVETITGVLALLDAVVFWGGVAACIAAIGLLGCYGWSRRRRLVVAVSGERDLELPLSSPPSGLAGSIEAAIDPGSPGPPNGGATDDRESGPGADSATDDGSRSGPGATSATDPGADRDSTADVEPDRDPSSDGGSFPGPYPDPGRRS